MNKPIIFFDYSGTLNTKRPIHPELVECIKNISEDYILTVVSSSSSRTIEQNLERAGIKDLFNEIAGYGRHQGKTKKMKGLLTTYQLEPEQGLMVTDTTSDLRAANSAGVKSIAVTWGFENKQRLQQTKPDEIVENPENLEQTIKKLV
jgi:phosphoglycolate phosphatase-like HAD superfamily hydrolase